MGIINRTGVAFGIVMVAGFLNGCGEQKPSDAPYQVEVKRTSFGIPHITASDFGSLGFGEGYVAAEDHVCNIAHGIVTARGERSKYHGVGDKKQHLMSDIIVRAMEIPDHMARDFATQSQENRSWVTGYAAGYNKYIREVGRDNITSWCRGAEWVREITPEELFSRFQLLSQTTPRMADMIVSAAPPEKSGPKKSGQKTSTIEFPPQNQTTMIADMRAEHLGSNGWAFGRDRTETGRGLLLANPHYPWTGIYRFWEKHLTIPGRMDVYGVNLIGAPGVAIGFNRDIGWTHTVSKSNRVAFYRLDLVPGDPTSYYYDGLPRKMTVKKLAIPVRGKDGAEGIIDHNVWFSHYGPMVSLPDVPWTDAMALTIRDANLGNLDLLNQWKDMGLASDMDAFIQAHRKWNAMPWVNSMATSRDGRAVYIDGSNVGRISDGAIALWRERAKSDPLTKSFHRKMNLILLDGSDSRFEWQPHPMARAPGVVPFAEQPYQDRTDYIFNANDSHWLTNVDHPLTGYSPFFGAENTARTLRTRMNALLVSDVSPDGPAGRDGKFSLKEMQQAIFSNRSLAAEILLDELVAACEVQNMVAVDDQTVDLTPACVVLKNYNRRLDLDSRGAVLFREWITRYKFAETLKNDRLFSVAFDMNDPVNTPRGLANRDMALQNLARAVLVMKAAGLALDSALREAQFAYRGDEKIPLHGGDGIEGVANIISGRAYDALAKQVTGKKVGGSKLLTDKGYPITYGTSFLLSLSYTEDGPVAEAILTYGQSGDPASPHYTDQTRLFSAKQWRPILFKTADINKDIKSSYILTGPRK